MRLESVSFLALVAAACSTSKGTPESGTSTGGTSAGVSAGQSGANPAGSGTTGSETGGTVASFGGGGVAGTTGGTAGTAVSGASGSMGTSGASSGAGGTQDVGIMQGPCTANTLKPGNSTLMISSGGDMRSYILHVPAKYDGKTRLPLVIDMHGKGGTAQGQMSGSGWLAKSDAVGLVMIYPQGLYNSWNGGPANCPILMCCCEPAQDHNIDDAGFIRAAVAKTAQDGCIDLKRVYATGLSNGGVMSHWLGCDAADVFAAVAPVSGGNMIDCKPSRPITVVNYRGRMDDNVLYNGGMSQPMGHVWPSAMADFTKWSDLDTCTDAPVPMPMHPPCQIRSQCAGGAEVVLCSPNAGHVLYGEAASEMVAVPDVAWEVFQRHALP